MGATPPQTLTKTPRVNRGEAGRVLRELRAKDYVFTVVEAPATGPIYQRIKLRGNGFLRDHAPYPTMWVRLWFTNPADAGAGHQRAYTLVDPNPSDDTFWLEFLLHDGPAAEWAKAAQVGDEIEASLYGSEPALPDCTSIDSHLLVGDAASLPAINSLLDALGPAPATVILEAQNPQQRHADVRARVGDTVQWVARGGAGERVIEATYALLEAAGSQQRECERPALRLAEEPCPRIFAWAACDTVTTRTLTKMFRTAGLRKDCIKTLGYWQPPQARQAA